MRLQHEGRDPRKAAIDEELSLRGPKTLVATTDTGRSLRVDLPGIREQIVETALWIAGLWLAFAITHTWPASVGTRRRLIGRLGEGPYLGLYSLVALVLFALLAWTYFTHLHGGPLLWSLGDHPWIRSLAFVVAFLGFTLAVAGFFQPSATAIVVRGARKARGLARITRHPLFVGLAMIALGHLLLFGFATDVAFLGGLLVYSLFGAWHQDLRKRAEGERLRDFYAETSILPFGAVLAGRTRLVLGELPWLGFAVGAAAAWGFYRLHGPLFG
jgi:uncharacterized membrane protein